MFFGVLLGFCEGVLGFYWGFMRDFGGFSEGFFAVLLGFFEFFGGFCEGFWGFIGVL